MCLEYETRQAGKELRREGVKFYMLLSQVRGVGGGAAALCGGSNGLLGVLVTQGVIHNP